MPKNPFPSFDWYARDWLSSEARAVMTAEQRAGYLDLLSHAWLMDPPGSLPNDDRALANLSGLGEDRWREAGPIIRQWFVEKGDRLVNVRIAKHFRERLAIRRQKQEGGKEGGRKSAELRKKRGKDTLRTASSSGAAESNPSPSPSPSPSPKDTPFGSSSAGADHPGPDDLLGLWRETCVPVGLPDVRAFDPELRRKTSSRLREQPNFDVWRDVFTRIAASRFCRGEVGTNGRKAWRADFRWCVASVSNHLKVLEGKYDDAAANGAAVRGAYTPC